MEWILVKTLLSLVAVVGLMIGVVYLLRKYVYQGTGGISSLVAVEILGQRALHPKRSIVVLKVLHTVLVVGMSEQGMQTLATIEDQQSLENIEEKLQSIGTHGRWTAKSPVSANAAHADGFAGQLQDVVKAFSTKRSRAHGVVKKGGKSA